MNVLLIGGTQFVGRHIADALVQCRHTITLFNRGTLPEVHASLEQIHGDRSSDLQRLGERSWDAVVDTSGYTPGVVETAAQFFQSRANRYVFISTCSVYAHNPKQGPDESSPLLELPEGIDPAQRSDEYYGHLKVLCERVVQRTYGERATILRPGLVAGPYDPTDRFTYWPLRFDAGGEILAPQRARPLQYIDARDLAVFTAHLIGNNIAGVFNCVTPRGALLLGDLYDACAHEAAAEDANVITADDAWLLQHDVQPWTDLPLWLSPEWESFAATDTSRANAAGLRTRDIRETVRDTLAWARIAGKHLGALANGLSPERECALLGELSAA